MRVPYHNDDLLTELDQIVHVFDLGEVKGILPGVGGTFCEVVGLETSKSQFIVRALYPETKTDRVIAVHSVLVRLRQDGLLVPDLVQTTTGATFMQLGGNLVEVQGYVPHIEEPEYNLIQLQNAFNYLGHLHHALSGYGLDSLPPPPANIYRPLASSLSVLDEAEMRQATIPSLSTRRQLSLIYERTRQLLKYLSELQNATRVDLPRIVIHGDYHLGNVFFQDNSIAGIIDFDMLGWGERLFELAHVLYSIDDAVRHEIRRDLYTGQFEIVSNLFRQYALGYKSFLTVHELDVLPAMLARVWLNMIALKGAYSLDPINRVLAMADDIGWCEWLIEHRSEISTELKEKLSSAT